MKAEFEILSTTKHIDNWQLVANGFESLDDAKHWISRNAWMSDRYRVDRVTRETYSIFHMDTKQWHDKPGSPQQ